MLTATVRELRNHYRRVLARVESGEAVAISRRGKVIARLVPENPGSSGLDWAHSAAVQTPRSKKAAPYKAVRKALNDNKGRY